MAPISSPTSQSTTTEFTTPRLANLGPGLRARLLAGYLQKSPVIAQDRAVHAIVALFPRLLPGVHAAADVTLIAFVSTPLAVPMHGSKVSVVEHHQRDYYQMTKCRN
jgi:hypothetical protein